MRVSWLLCFALAGCVMRTQLEPVKRVPVTEVYVGEKRCDVYDYENATDLPDGAKNLGWVEVQRLESDEETYLALRKKLCEQGGNALSQMAWVAEIGDREPTKLKANAWLLP